MLAPVIEQYVGENKDITVLKVDVDEEEALKFENKSYEIKGRIAI